MNPLAQLTQAIALATALGGEVILNSRGALAIMEAAGLRLWDDLATAAGADISYDASISAFRFTAMECTLELSGSGTAGHDVPPPHHWSDPLSPTTRAALIHLWGSLAAVPAVVFQNGPSWWQACPSPRLPTPAPAGKP